ncbi:hypothetical protein D3C74_82830 [compost metagenome]
MQRNTRPSVNQPRRTSSTNANTAVSGQPKATSPQINRAAASPAKGSGSHTSTTTKVVICRKCKSQQVVANKRGYSFANLFKTLGIMILVGILCVVASGTMLLYSNTNGAAAVLQILSVLAVLSFSLCLPVSILMGFVGRGHLVNGCMNCGFKWIPAKRK